MAFKTPTLSSESFSLQIFRWMDMGMRAPAIRRKQRPNAMLSSGNTCHQYMQRNAAQLVMHQIATKRTTKKIFTNTYLLRNV